LREATGSSQTNDIAAKAIPAPFSPEWRIVDTDRTLLESALAIVCLLPPLPETDAFEQSEALV
jgi:hypothetical protein